MNSLEYQGPVTAVHFKENYLYAGAGPFLKKFDWKTSQLVSSVQVFKENKIHGITSQGGNMVVWGGRSFAFSPEFEEYTTADWIISVSTFNDTIYILTAHNRVYIYRDGKVTSKSFDHSILYSGTIFCTNDRVLVASGTVLHGVLVWDLETQELLYNFDQHEGSIFDVEFSKDGLYLASCSDDRCIIVWDLTTGDLVAKGWGHTSRIWDLKFSSDKSHLYSISEDLTCRVWELVGQDLKCIDVLHGHTGRNVWALDVLETPEPLICTGGQDGAIKLWTKYLLGRSEETLPIDSALASPETGELYKGFCARNGLFIATTTKGHVVLQDQHGKWTNIDEQVGEYSLVKSVEKYIIICSKAGKLIVFDTETQTHRKIEIPLGGNFSFCSGVSIDNQAHVLVQGHDLKAPILMVNLATEQVLVIKSPLSQMITAVGHLNGKLFVGTRTGALCYTMLESIEWTKIDRILNSKDAVTSILATDHLIIASRSGSYGYFDEQLDQMYENKLQRGSIEGMQIQKNGDLLAFGFRKENLFINNLSSEYEVSNEWCGGGHRTWSLTIDSKDEACYDLSFVKASKLMRIVTSQRDIVPSNTMLRKRTHGREIRGMEFHPHIKDLVVTVSEDTTVNIGFVKENFIDISSSLRKHASPPQTVHWSRDGKLLGTAGAKEEMILWDVCMERYLRPRAVLPTVSDVPDLRVMDFDILNTDSGYLIACVYSDSTIRLWNYKNSEITLIKSGQYSDRCLLQAHFIESPNGLHLLVTATDGTLLLYNESLELLSKHYVHQSGIRGSTVRVTEDGVYIYSGGEDNCLAGTLLNWQWEFKEIFKNLGAHAATITDVLIDNGFIYSTGPDQKICKWTLTGELVQAERTSISDTACLTAQNGKIIACGLGACIYSL